MSSKCSFWHRKHVLEAKRTDSNLPLIRCIRCQRVWDYNGYERIPFGYENWGDWRKKTIKTKGFPSQAPEWGQSRYCTLSADELNPVLVEYVIKLLDIQDKIQIAALLKMGKEKRFYITSDLFKN